jgi:hypothetical protein
MDSGCSKLSSRNFRSAVLYEWRGNKMNKEKKRISAKDIFILLKQIKDFDLLEYFYYFIKIKAGL